MTKNVIPARYGFILVAVSNYNHKLTTACLGHSIYTLNMDLERSHNLY